MINTLRQILICCASLLLFGSASICLAKPSAPPVAPEDLDPSIDFATEIAPILVKNCVACHNAKKTEGGLNLESYNALMDGGDSGPSVTPTDPDDSYLMWRITGEEEPIMPPVDNAVGAKRLDDAQVALLNQWIKSGALPPKEASQTKMQWQPVSKSLAPTYALQSAPDGSFVAFSRGQNAMIIGSELILRKPGEAATQSSLLRAPALLRDASTEQSVGPIRTEATTHIDLVQSLAISPDSQRVASGGYRTLKIWKRPDTPDLKLQGLLNSPGPFAQSSDGKTIAYAVTSGGFEVVSTDGVAHRFLSSHKATVTSLCWTSDSDEILTADQAGSIVATNIKDFESTEIASVPDQTINSVTRISDSRFLLLTADETIYLLTKQTSGESPDPAGFAVQSTDLKNVVACEPLLFDEHHFLIATDQGEVQRVKLDDMTRETLLTTDLQIQSVIADDHAPLVMIVSSDGKTTVWSLETSKVVAELKDDYNHLRAMNKTIANKARQEQLLARVQGSLASIKAAAEQEEQARVKAEEARAKAAESLAEKTQKRTDNLEAVKQAEEAVAAAELAVEEAMKLVETRKAELEAKRKTAEQSEAEERKAAAEVDKRLQALATAEDSAKRAAARITETETRIAAETERLNALQSKLDQLNSTAQLPPTISAGFVSGHNQVVAAYQDGVSRLFSATDGKPLASFESNQQIRSGWQDSDGNWIVAGSDGSLLSWPLDRTWELESTVGSISQSIFSDRITALDFGPDGKVLAVGSGPPSRSGELKLLNSATGEIAIDFGEPHSDTILALKFSPSGRFLATAGADKIVRIFDLETQQLIQNLEGHSHYVLSLAWKDSEDILATGSADYSIKIWNVETGTQLRTIAAFNNEVSAIQFLGTSHQLLAASNAGQCKLFDTQNGSQIREFTGPSKALYALSTAAEDRFLLSAGLEGVIQVWRIENAEQINQYTE